MRRLGHSPQAKPSAATSAGRWGSEEYKIGDVRFVVDPWAQLRSRMVVDDAISVRPLVQHNYQIDVPYEISAGTICGTGVTIVVTDTGQAQLNVDKENARSGFFINEPIPERPTGSLFYSWPAQYGYYVNASGSHSEGLAGAMSTGFGSGASHAGLVERARTLERFGDSATALDLVYDCIDDLLYSDRFSLVACCLLEVEVGTCSVDILLALLTSTLPAKQRIGTRAEFIRRVETELLRRGEDVVQLLAGLK